MEGPPPGASAAATVEVDAASQASEPASQASDEEDAPSTDIYFVSSSKPPCTMAVTPASVSGVATLGGRPLLLLAVGNPEKVSSSGPLQFTIFGPGDPMSDRRAHTSCSVRWAWPCVDKAISAQTLGIWNRL